MIVMEELPREELLVFPKAPPRRRRVRRSTLVPQVYLIEFHRAKWFCCSACWAEANVRELLLHRPFCPVARGRQ